MSWLPQPHILSDSRPRYASLLQLGCSTTPRRSSASMVRQSDARHPHNAGAGRDTHAGIGRGDPSQCSPVSSMAKARRLHRDSRACEVRRLSILGAEIRCGSRDKRERRAAIRPCRAWLMPPCGVVPRPEDTTRHIASDRLDLREGRADEHGQLTASRRPNHGELIAVSKYSRGMVIRPYRCRMCGGDCVDPAVCPATVCVIAASPPDSVIAVQAEAHATDGGRVQSLRSHLHQPASIVRGALSCDV
jgi:hypothetical protein